MSAPERAAPAHGVPPTVKGLSLVSLFNDFASEMVYPLLPAFISRTLGGSATLIGALDGAADLTSALLKWISGRRTIDLRQFKPGDYWLDLIVTDAAGRRDQRRTWFQVRRDAGAAE